MMRKNNKFTLTTILRRLAYPLGLYLLWQLGLLVFQIFFQTHLKSTPESATLYQRLFVGWTDYWDTSHYQDIATHGYHYPNQAFFPLWPLMIKILTILGISASAAVFLLSFILGLVVFVLFYLLASCLTGKSQAKRALLIFASFPSTFFLHAGYSEGLFLALTLGSFVMLEREKYWIASLLGLAASATRLIGISLAAAFLVLKQPFRKRLLYFGFGCLGIVLYMIYLQIKFHDPLLFLEAQQSWCSSSAHCGLVFPLQSLLNSIFVLTRMKFSTGLVDWLTSVVFLSLSPVVFIKLKRPYFVYYIIVLIMPLFSGSVVSMSRYVLAAFPFFIVMASLIKSKSLFAVWTGLSLLIQLWFITLFTSDIWVA